MTTERRYCGTKHPASLTGNCVLSEGHPPTTQHRNIGGDRWSTPGAVDLTFTAPTTPLSINKAKGRHWAANKRLLEPWKDAAWVTARNALVQGLWPYPTNSRAISVQVVLPFRGRARRDAHNYTGTVVKAVVDGLVRARLVPDDTPEWVTVLDPEFSIQPDRGEPLTATVRIRPRETQP